MKNRRGSRRHRKGSCLSGRPTSSMLFKRYAFDLFAIIKYSSLKKNQNAPRPSEHLYVNACSR